MDAATIKKKKRITELNILSDIQTNLNMFRSLTGIKVTNIRLKTVQSGDSYQSRPIYDLVDVELDLEL